MRTAHDASDDPGMAADAGRDSAREAGDGMKGWLAGIPPELGQDVIACLGRLVPLPGRGILAGQAVGCALRHLLCGTPLHVNDVDVFTTVAPAADIPAVLDDGFSGWRQAIALPDAYLDTFTPEIACAYVVSSSVRHGLLNRIEVIGRENYGPHALIAGFDINSTAAGVDLESGFLYTTRDFRRFLATAQLELQTLRTPARTALRFVAKAARLGCYANLPLALETLAAAVRLYPHVKGRGRAEVFTEKHRAMFEAHAAVLAPYFTCERAPALDGAPAELWMLVPRADAGCAALAAAEGQSLYKDDSIALLDTLLWQYRLRAGHYRRGAVRAYERRRAQADSASLSAATVNAVTLGPGGVHRSGRLVADRRTGWPARSSSGSRRDPWRFVGRGRYRFQAAARAPGTGARRLGLRPARDLRARGACARPGAACPARAARGDTRQRRAGHGRYCAATRPWHRGAGTCYARGACR